MSTVMIGKARHIADQWPSVMMHGMSVLEGKSFKSCFGTYHDETINIKSVVQLIYSESEKEMTVPRFLLFTFSDAERVVSAGDKVIKCKRRGWVALGSPPAGSPWSSSAPPPSAAAESRPNGRWRASGGREEAMERRERKVKPYDKCDWECNIICTGKQ